MSRIAFYMMALTPMVQSAEKGAYPEVMCATEDGLDQKAYYGPTKRNNWVGPVGECEIESHALDKPVADKLWDLSEKETDFKWNF